MRLSLLELKRLILAKLLKNNKNYIIMLMGL